MVTSTTSWSREKIIARLVELHKRGVPLKIKEISEKDPALIGAIYDRTPGRRMPRYFDSITDARAEVAKSLEREGDLQGCNEVIFVNTRKKQKKKFAESSIPSISDIRSALKYARELQQNSFEMPLCELTMAFEALRVLQYRDYLQTKSSENNHHLESEETKAVYYSIVHSNRGLISLVIKSMGVNPIRFYQEGQEGLEEAVDSYRPEEGTNFSRFATIKIRSCVMDKLEEQDLQRSLESRIPGKGRVIKSLEDYRFDDPAEKAMERDLQEYLDREIKRFITILTERQERFVEMRYGLNGYGEGKTCKQIGEESDPPTTKANISRIVKKSLKKLRKEPAVKRTYAELIS